MAYETFQLPDLRGRTAVEAGQGPGLSAYNEGKRLRARFDPTDDSRDSHPKSLPLPVLGLTVTADNATVNAGSTAGFTVTVQNTGLFPTIAAAATLSDPLPDLGGGNLWSINRIRARHDSQSPSCSLGPPVTRCSSSSRGLDTLE